jgi:hypothetical protein
MTFKSNRSGDVLLWIGDPDCQAGHQFLLDRLKTTTHYFISMSEPLGTRRKGNLGEFIAFEIGKGTAALAQTLRFCANAANPLNNISISDLDITWVHFAPDPSGDHAYIQEVKTTSQMDLAYASTLADDYSKLFGTNIALTLNTRLQVISNKLEHEHGAPGLAKRAAQLASIRPEHATKIRLIPTIVHDKSSSSPVTKLTAIKSEIAGYGWLAASIDPCAIALSDLEDRLLRLARGQP